MAKRKSPKRTKRPARVNKAARDTIACFRDFLRELEHHAEAAIARGDSFEWQAEQGSMIDPRSQFEPFIRKIPNGEITLRTRVVRLTPSHR